MPFCPAITARRCGSDVHVSRKAPSVAFVLAATSRPFSAMDAITANFDRFSTRALSMRPTTWSNSCSMRTYLSMPLRTEAGALPSRCQPQRGRERSTAKKEEFDGEEAASLLGGEGSGGRIEALGGKRSTVPCVICVMPVDEGQAQGTIRARARWPQSRSGCKATKSAAQGHRDATTTHTTPRTLSPLGTWRVICRGRRRRWPGRGIQSRGTRARRTHPAAAAAAAAHWCERRRGATVCRVMAGAKHRGRNSERAAMQSIALAADRSSNNQRAYSAHCSSVARVGQLRTRRRGGGRT